MNTAAARKKLYLLLGSVMLATAAFGFRLAVNAQMAPQPNRFKSRENSASTSAGDWKLYVNKAYKYRIEYPPVASLDESRASKVSIEFIQEWESRGSKGTARLSFDINVSDNHGRLTAREWALKQWEADFIRERQDVSIDGVPGYNLKIFEFDQYSNHIYLAKRTSMYELSFSNPETISEFTPDIQRQYRELFQKMVSSFHLQ